ncbi:MAG: hypothetical protein R2691_03840 [Solirubrobacterales bacterium]
MLQQADRERPKKVEEQNYLSRKRVLEYDDVMNEQRRVVYKYRREVLEAATWATSRASSSAASSPTASTTTRPPTSSRVGPRRPRDAARNALAGVGRPRRARPANLESRAGDRAAHRGRARRLRRA